MLRVAVAIASIAFLFTALSVMAQEGRGEISAQLTGQFTKDSTSPTTSQSASNSAGLLVGYRHPIFRWVSAEAVYGYSRDTQRYFQPVGLARVQSNINQFTGGLVFNLPFFAGLRPYGLAEGGALVFSPTGNGFGAVPVAQRDSEGVFVYGVGVDHPLLTSHLLLRVEYRGLVYHAPDFGLPTLNTNSVTHTAQPSVGMVFRF